MEDQNLAKMLRKQLK